MSKTNFRMVKEFNKLTGVLPSTSPDKDDLSLAVSLVDEELIEVAEAMQDEYDYREEGDVQIGGVVMSHEQRVQHLAKEIAGLLYVAYGLADRYSFDIDAVFAAVHESKCTKFCYSATELTQSLQALKEQGVDAEFKQEGWTDDGKPIYVITRKEDGKVMKSINYKEPSLCKLV